jgi:hypothetical protein
MRRLRAFGYSILITLAVFVYLALPMLRSMFGPTVNLVIYGAVALLAGRIAWLLLAGVENTSTDQIEPDELDEDIEIDEDDVANELETIKEKQ